MLRNHAVGFIISLLCLVVLLGWIGRQNVLTRTLTTPSSSYDDVATATGAATTTTDDNDHHKEVWCRVHKDPKTNTFSFVGDWQFNPNLARALDEQHQEFACNEPQEQLLHPYNSHQCCSAKGYDSPYLTSVFCPSTFTSASNLPPPAAEAAGTPQQKQLNDTTSSVTNKHRDYAIYMFLNATRNKTILFLGDSIALQTFASLGMQLQANQIPFQHSWRYNRRQQTYKVASNNYNTTIQLVEMYRLQNVSRSGLNADTTIPETSPYNLQDEDWIDSNLKQADVLISNFGLHDSS